MNIEDKRPPLFQIPLLNASRISHTLIHTTGSKRPRPISARTYLRDAKQGVARLPKPALLNLPTVKQSPNGRGVADLTNTQWELRAPLLPTYRHRKHGL